MGSPYMYLDVYMDPNFGVITGPAGGLAAVDARSS